HPPIPLPSTAMFVTERVLWLRQPAAVRTARSATGSRARDPRRGSTPGTIARSSPTPLPAATPGATPDTSRTWRRRAAAPPPRPDSAGAGNRAGTAGAEGAHQIRYQLVRGPVAAADGVPGARARQRHAVTPQLARREERLPVGRRDQLRAALGVRVGIVPAHR